MTLGILWVRAVGGVRELVVASDSRLSGGQFWDSNPKIMLLPRSDCVLSFAGSKNDAYPLMLQAWNNIRMHPPAMDRGMDISDLKGHIIRVFNHSRAFISGLPRDQTVPDDPDAIFSLSGYSWRSKKFHIWKLHFDRSLPGYTFRPTKEWGGQEGDAYKLVAYVGDEPAIKDAKQMLVALLRERGKLSSGSLNMEPFEVLRNIIRGGRFPSVGGPIQLVKVYEHANSVPIAVYWPNRASGTVSVLGRPLMDYERVSWGIIDPDAPERARPIVWDSKADLPVDQNSVEH